MFAGLLALIVPGVFAAVCLLLLRPVVLFDGRDPLQCSRPLLQSGTTACGSRCWPARVIAGLIFVICVIAAGGVPGDSANRC